MISTLGLSLISISNMTVKATSNSTSRIDYNIEITSPHSHYANVTVLITGVKPGDLEIYMPVWTPGSYLVREFAKNVEGVSVIGFTNNQSLNAVSEIPTGGKLISATKSNKNTWKILIPKGIQSIEFNYKVYCFELSVRTSFIDDDQALLNMASVLMAVKGSENQGGDLYITYPMKWDAIASALDHELISRVMDESENLTKNHTAYLKYPNFDDLVDAPIQLGNYKILKFNVNGVPHQIAMVGINNANEQKLTDDMKLMCSTMANIVNDHPCKRYTFIIQNVETGGGGLEHKNGAVLMMNRWAYSDPNRYKVFLGLVAHEYFHLWNVKRIRPLELGPFDYNNENYTSMLWLAEGVTSYYDELALMRAGIVSRKEFLNTMASYVNTHENRMGARVATISEMSHDAWIKEYRPNENSKNSTYSYYSKGVIVGMLLDAWISAYTTGEKNLDDVMRFLWKNYYLNKSFGVEGRGITEHEFISAINNVIGEAKVENQLKISLDKITHQLLHTTETPDYQNILSAIGLEILINTTPVKKFGLTCETAAGKTMVKSIHAHPTAAGFQLKVNVNDELISINGLRIDNNIDELYAKIGFPEDVVITVSRGGLLRELKGKFTTYPEVKYEFSLNESTKTDAYWNTKGALQTWLKLKN